MTHEPKFVRAIERLGSQIERKDYGAALRTFAQTGYLPGKAVRRFVAEAPSDLGIALLYAFKQYCEKGLMGENVFDRSLLLSAYLSACAVHSIITYYREKQSLLSTLSGFGVPVPLVLTQMMREVEQRIKRAAPHEKFLASGFTRVHCDKQFSKYKHPELDFLVVVRTHPAEVKKLDEELGQGVRPYRAGNT
jgi:hypothetical protein